MLTAEGCAARRERLWRALPSPCDVLVVGDPSHLTYFAGYSPSPFVFRTVESGALLLLEPGRATLVADAMLGPFVEAALVDERVAAGVVRRPAFGPVSSGPARRVDARPAGEHARAAGSASSWRRCPPGSSRAFGPRGRSSRSSISDR